ncbi:hypothetical protein GWY41_14450 [Salmonella enterica subsp. enterica serovar Bredeney]|nr:hypothetical protein [Salmonella enterica subsp. enterica serovar Bredeney]EDR7301330.1 hypothetical protein [Salmonella enterica subsp. enterica serovar Bredeney]EEG1541197.1 hypothetical protein [Salmonella enterica subsp. enterica serovar Bredeney]
MSLIQKAQAAVGIMTDLTASLLEQKTKLEAQIAEKNDAIQKLLNMPMNIDDFCSFISEHVRIKGDDFYDRLSYENRDSNLMPWGAVESENGKIAPSHFYIKGTSGTLYSDVNMAAFARECFFHPENTVKRLTDKFRAELAKSWGNEQLPTIAERRVTIKTLQAERDAIQADLDDINANINGILNATNGINNPRAAIKAPQAERDEIEAELNGDNSSVSETPDSENTTDTTSATSN